MYPVSARNGRELFYVTLDGTIVSVPVEASGSCTGARTSASPTRGGSDVGRVGDTWHLDELFVTIRSQRQFLWLAVE